jgi:hypothetical protein
VFQPFADALLDGRVEVPRHRTANDAFGELEVGVGRRLQFEEDVTELAGAAGLLLVLVLGNRLGEIVSRYATRGRPSSTLTPNRRVIRSSAIWT